MDACKEMLQMGENLVLPVCSATGGHMKSLLPWEPKNETKLPDQYEIPFVLSLQWKKNFFFFFLMLYVLLAASGNFML